MLNFKKFFQELEGYKRRLLFAYHNGFSLDKINEITQKLDWFLRTAPEVRCIHEAAMYLMDCLELIEFYSDEERRDTLPGLIEKIDRIMECQKRYT